MKKFADLFCLLILVSSPLLAAYSSLYFRFASSYDSNILHLSDNDIDQFSSDNYNVHSKLSSVDDYIYSFRTYLKYKNYFVAGHTQIDKLTFGYDKYQKNGFNDFKFISFQIDQYFSKFLILFTKYFYYPDVYINHYRSELESSGIYREFSYSKDKYVTGGSFRFPNLFKFEYAFEYAQSYYNKYFSYYNSDIFNNSFSLRLSPWQQINAKAKYSYEISIADILEESGHSVLDASYNSDIYYFSLSFPFHLIGSQTKLFYSCKFEDKFYLSDLPIAIDEFHANRNDQIFTHHLILKYPFSKYITLRGSYEFEKRNTHSPSDIVEREKNYSAYELGLGFSFQY